METQVKIISLAKRLHGFGLLDLNQLLQASSKVVWEKGEDIFTRGRPG
jgi:hypothetical protein